MSLYVTDDNGQLHKSKNPVQNKTLYNPVVFAENERQKSKNLLIAPYASGSKTENGITFTANEDGSIHIQGTATKTTYYTFVSSPNFVHLENKKYSYSVRDINGDVVSSVRLELWKNGDHSTLKNGYGYITDTFVEADYNDVYMSISKNTVIDITIYPQLELGEITEWREYNGTIVHEKQLNKTIEKRDLIFDYTNKINISSSVLTTLNEYIDLFNKDTSTNYFCEIGNLHTNNFKTLVGNPTGFGNYTGCCIKEYLKPYTNGNYNIYKLLAVDLYTSKIATGYIYKNADGVAYFTGWNIIGG